MPKKRKPQLTAWSYSRKRDYKGCPLKAKIKYIDRVREPENKAMQRGQVIHKKAGCFVSGETRKLPAELDTFDEEFKYLRKIRKRVEIESEFAVDSKWQPTGWFDPDAWCRAKVDFLYTKDNGGTIEIIDVKTGRVNPNNEEQLQLYPAVLINYYPNAKRFNCAFWYVDHGIEDRKTYTRKEALAFQKKFDTGIKRMLADRIFKATPGNACRWCFYKAANKGIGGGQCKF